LSVYASIPGAAKLDFTVWLVDGERTPGLSGSPFSEGGPRWSFEEEAEAQVLR